VTETEPFEIVYCPHHLTVHDSAWCTAGDHEGLGTPDGDLALAEARRRGRCFYHGDVINIEGPDKRFPVGTIVGDKRCVTNTSAGPRFHLSYLREVVEADDERVTWRRPGKTSHIYVCSIKTWKNWARGSWRCGPDGVPTNRRWRLGKRMPEEWE
jgi:hypothetical protein